MALPLNLAMAMLLIQRAASTLPPINVTLRNVPEDGLIDFMGMSKKYGFSATAHQITTEDNYTLTTFNIPGDRSRVVLLSHGIFDTADGWILRRERSLGMLLADAGYDVWLLNQRGSRYSRADAGAAPRYWDYSVHELGLYDLAANIDYVLAHTGQTQLSIVAFSEGTSMSFVLASLRPEYNAKVRTCICLAPIAYLHNTEGLMGALVRLGPFLDAVLPAFVAEIGGYFSFSKALINVLCTQLPFGYDLCFRGIVSSLVGPNVDAVERAFFELAVGHFPAGTSRRNLIHYSQIGCRSEFAAYDHGRARNLELYGSAEPPRYELGRVTMPVLLVSGRNDRVSTLADVRRLRDELPNVTAWLVVDDPDFNHLDHLWANNAHRVVYEPVLKELAKYNPAGSGPSAERTNSTL